MTSRLGQTGTSASRERIALRMGNVALDLRRCVAAQDRAGVTLLLHRRARSAPEKHAVAIVLADLLNAALGLTATPEAVETVKDLAARRGERAA